jgi:hypothetical protein
LKKWLRFVSILTLLVVFEDNWIVEMEMNHWMSFLPCTYVDQACQSPYEAHKNIGIIQISLCNLKRIDKFFSKNWRSFEFRCNWFSILLIDIGLIHICLDFLHVVENLNIFCLWIMLTIVFVLNILDSSAYG